MYQFRQSLFIRRIPDGRARVANLFSRLSRIHPIKVLFTGSVYRAAIPKACLVELNYFWLFSFFLYSPVNLGGTYDNKLLILCVFLYNRNFVIFYRINHLGDEYQIFAVL